MRSDDIVNDMAKFRDLIKEAEAPSNASKILSHVDNVHGDGVDISVEVNQEIFPGITANSFHIFVSLEDDYDHFPDGPLSLSYTISDSIDPDDAIGEFYYDPPRQLEQYLIAAGFSPEAARLEGTELGMQDEGQASYEGGAIAAEVRAAIGSSGSEIAISAGRNILTDKGFDVGNADANKAEIIKWMLETIKGNGKLTFAVKVAAEFLIKSGKNWPELAVILKA